VRYYQCNQGGVYKPKGTGKRQIKSQGTCKIQQNCTATLEATTTEDGKITVDLCLTHYGHQQDLQHTWLPKQKKEEMAALLQQGVSKDKILGDIRENWMQGEAFKRYHLTDMKDLSNISRAFGLGEVQRSENDQVFVLTQHMEPQDRTFC